MDNNTIIERQSVSHETIGTDSTHSTSTFRSTLTEMGPASVETKGFLRGIELGFTPRSG
jgi:hypothetical protein